MFILGIESSCDETGVAIYCTTRQKLIAHALFSQIKMHQAYGGVVPELASRDHIRRLCPLLREVLQSASCQLKDLGAIAYTKGPGLAGALLAGASFAEGLGASLNIPLIPIHHLEGHLLSPLLSFAPPKFPFVALLVSGGHSQLMRVTAVGKYQLLGETLDDAAGEAFDKTAKLLGLDYPGGALLSELAQKGIAGKFTFPRPLLHSGDLNFSFSGLKTAVLTKINALKNEDNFNEQNRANIAAAFEEAIIEVLAKKSLAALAQTKLTQLVVAGGVGANKSLRRVLNEKAAQQGFSVFYPEFEFCTDNGAMIAQAGALRILQKNDTKKAGAFSVKPRWALAEIVDF